MTDPTISIRFTETELQRLHSAMTRRRLSMRLIDYFHTSAARKIAQGLDRIQLLDHGTDRVPVKD